MARFHVDLPLLGAVLVVCSLGLVVLFSASDQSADTLTKQSIRMAFGLFVMLVLAQVTPQTIQRWAPGVYVIGIAMLVVVLFFGTGRSAQRWLDAGVVRFQPSEIMKLAVPLTVAAFLCEVRLPPHLRATFIALVIIGIPAALIVKQPDLGTAILVASSGFFVLFFAGVRWRFIRNASIVGLAAAPFAWFLLHDYQRQRILTLFDPTQDPLGAGYHIIQSTIAVGSGGLYGKGWLNGTQSHLEFVPERATDFIFAVYCEEFGLLGVVVLLAAYSLIILRGLVIAANAQEMFGRLIAASLVATFFVYIFVNIGMVSGQLPVVGIPLPLISYGGTSMVTIMAGFGILMSINTHRRFISSI
ncbi:MAG: rod shape-determining protein RodA [Pseudomonadota bacterium]